MILLAHTPRQEDQSLIFKIKIVKCNIQLNLRKKLKRGEKKSSKNTEKKTYC